MTLEIVSQFFYFFNNKYSCDCIFYIIFGMPFKTCFEFCFMNFIRNLSCHFLGNFFDFYAENFFGSPLSFLRFVFSRKFLWYLKTSQVFLPWIHHDASFDPSYRGTWPSLSPDSVEQNSIPLSHMMCFFSQNKSPSGGIEWKPHTFEESFSIYLDFCREITEGIPKWYIKIIIGGISEIIVWYFFK